MAGLVALFEAETTQEGRVSDFQRLLETTTRFKDLKLPDEQAIGCACTAAKLDAPSSLHRGIVHDKKSRSWLLAAGTVVALEGNNDPHTLLENLLVDYINKGTHALERYDGHFALAIYNGRENCLSIISDPMGLFAIYYARRGQQIYISSSALALARQVHSKADTLMIECFLRTGRTHGEKTFWLDVKRMRPATIIRITPESLREYEYWSPKIDKNIARLPLQEAVEFANEKICRVYEKIFSREAKVWADLTGGFDTRVTTMYLAIVGIPFIANCVGPSSHPDVEISRLICQKMSWEYQNLSLPENWGQEQISWFEKALRKGDGNLDVVQLASALRIQQNMSLIHNVHVTGGGVDEWRYHIFGSKILFPSEKTRINYDDILNSRILYPIPVSVMRVDHASNVRNELLEHLLRLQTGFLDCNALEKSDIMFMRHRHPIHGGAYLSSQSGLGRTLLPFCFKELQSFGLSLKHTWRLDYHYSFVRHMIEKGCSPLAEVRTVVGGPVMPIRLTNAYKFLPLGTYLIDHFLQKAMQKLFGKPSVLFPAHRGPEKPASTWRISWLEWAVSEELLEPSKMFSGALYDTPNLLGLVSQERSGVVHSGEFLDRVITIELALRDTGASVE